MMSQWEHRLISTKWPWRIRRIRRTLAHYSSVLLTKAQSSLSSIMTYLNRTQVWLRPIVTIATPHTTMQALQQRLASLQMELRRLITSTGGWRASLCKIRYARSPAPLSKRMEMCQSLISASTTSNSSWSSTWVAWWRTSMAAWA